MITTTVKHGRNNADGAKLAIHLAKTENEIAVIAEIGNSIAETIPNLIAEMNILRDAAKSKYGIHHVTINPSRDHPRHVLLAAAHSVRLELDPGGERKYGIIFHRKQRAEPGGSCEHVHLLIANIDKEGKALDDGWIKLRTEKLARIFEYDHGENAILGRHFSPCLKVLRTERPEVASWLIGQFGETPAKPSSALTPGARGKARSQKLNIAKAKAAVRAAWIASDGDIDLLQAEFTKLSFNVVRGDKKHVWIVQDAQHRMIGSLDRLVKVPRSQIDNLFSRSNYGLVVQLQSAHRSEERPIRWRIPSFAGHFPRQSSVPNHDQQWITSLPTDPDAHDIWGIPLPPPKPPLV